MGLPLYDLWIIGGGINGTGIACDAAGRGLKTGLCEQADLASATSSASSKLIHGGLRYLEYYEFRLVREALHEREVLMKKAPHIVWPMRFILPYRPHLRPSWMLRTGLFLYDHLSHRDSLPNTKTLKFHAVDVNKSATADNTSPLTPESPLLPSITHGFEYSDCWVDDARLVILNALQAQQAGADIYVRTRCDHAEVDQEGYWLLTLSDQTTGQQWQCRSRALVNAAGPWVESFIRQQIHQKPHYGIRMIKGSHLITRRLNTDDRAYILQNQDKRIVFVLPYQKDFSLIGTTDQPYHGNPAEAKISDTEIQYLLDVIKDYFKQPLTHDDIVTTFAGVRPLCDDESDNPSAMTRDYTLDLSTDAGAPLLSIFGGKITTYRKLAETALKMLTPYFPKMAPAWTATAPLPGGDIDNRETYAQWLQQRYPFLTAALAERYASSYGRLCERFLADKTHWAAMGEDFGAGLTEAEVHYLIKYEWARTIEDILWRRSKLQLQLPKSQTMRLQEFIKTLIQEQ
ncbi:glycerol-3-phosphate dehydrogenase [Terasakiispira papahanaumokuakeensis]|uniref:Glycerol-3-phosphate dehydrogenase n=2 Tax=Terasakiispira papahanaumokuakeensis TaxID=197479 RepID=A0A1E2V8P0_9GAMM|nr:glycerol-3-phosphate dehydrogenase [Terasakiispira papahanaumokuakeensis]ODC03206.1 glycerol-3-phosphate dehydrogenase [Terasakiispira papahanaumokuakeensis]